MGLLLSYTRLDNPFVNASGFELFSKDVGQSLGYHAQHLKVVKRVLNGILSNNRLDLSYSIIYRVFIECSSE